jgi:uncharacterized membrane protein YedE/YeeE
MRAPMKTPSLLVTFIAGALFGCGLAVSTMTQPEVVLSFQRFQDFGLLFVLGGAAGVTLLAYQLAPRLLRRPLAAPAFAAHPLEPLGRTIAGAALFGLGWGLCGVCPGPAIAGLGTGNWPLLIAVAGIFAGAWVQGRWFGRMPAASATATAAAKSSSAKPTDLNTVT